MTITPGKLGPTAKSQGQPDGSVLMNGLTGGLGEPSLPRHTGVIYMVLDTVLAAPVRGELCWGFSREDICLGKEFPKDYLDLALAAAEIYLCMEAESPVPDKLVTCYRKGSLQI